MCAGQLWKPRRYSKNLRGAIKSIYFTTTSFFKSEVESAYAEFGLHLTVSHASCTPPDLLAITFSPFDNHLFCAFKLHLPDKLRDLTELEPRSTTFSSDGVTVCRLVPMESRSCRIVRHILCLIKRPFIYIQFLPSFKLP